MKTPENPARKTSLKDPLQYLKGVGPKRAWLFSKLGLNTVEDGLYFLPHRFEDRTRVKKIGQLIEGEQITFTGTVIDADVVRLGRRKKLFQVLVEDDTGNILFRWFKFSEAYMREKFAIGRQLIVSGKPTRGSGRALEMTHPDVEIVPEDSAETLATGSITPVYHTTEGLPSKSLRAIMTHLVERYAPLMTEFLPAELVRRNQLMERTQAFREAHFPPPDTAASDLIKMRTPAQFRIIFEELFLIQLGLATKRKHAGEQDEGVPFKTRGPLIQRFVQLLPFELTGAQKKVLRHIMENLEQPRPMNRLLHGDVGSGKTIVALTTLLTAVDNGAQGALMAPTELLAEQHFMNIQPYCEALGLRLELLVSNLKDKNKILEDLAKGDIHLVVGTHALIQKDVQFKNLGLAVIDEQHRFGVLQRDAIGKKGQAPHLLVMTATPIPRSLAMTLYGDMDISILDELPPGRQAIRTERVDAGQRDRAYDFLNKELAAGRQAYVVCPLIEESETLDLKTAESVVEDLESRFQKHKVKLIHGRLKKEERQTIMADFKKGGIDILVATTVIEVGIDIPNATLMVVEHAERFGLAQLHQLRGRVGRGAHASHCLLIAYPPVSESGQARLKAMVESNDGFVIAEEDLKIRGPGDFMGTRQSGLPDLKAADLIRDIKIIETTRKEAFALIDRDPHLEHPDHHQLKAALQHKLGDRLDLADIL